MTTLQPELVSTLRRRSITTIEINGRDGRRKTVDLSELSNADRQLAEQFGYKPVSTRTYSFRPPISCLMGLIGVQERVRILVDLLLRRQYQWTVCDRGHYLFVSPLRWRIGFGSMVLADIRCRLHVYRLLRRRTRLSVSNVRRAVLHRLQTCAKRMGSANQLDCRMDQLTGPSSRRCIIRIWLCANVARCRLNGLSS